jgi:hypothetical protein
MIAGHASFFYYIVLVSNTSTLENELFTANEKLETHTLIEKHYICQIKGVKPYVPKGVQFYQMIDPCGINSLFTYRVHFDKNMLTQVYLLNETKNTLPFPLLSITHYLTTLIHYGTHLLHSNLSIITLLYCTLFHIITIKGNYSRTQ